MRSLVLKTIGRRSGQKRENAVFYIERHGDLIVMPSNGGKDAPPAWWLNLQARPETEVRIGRKVLSVRAREATVEEESALWPILEAAFPHYGRFRRKTSRRIPIVILEPVGDMPRGEVPA